MASDSEEGEGFTVRDRRRFLTDEPETPPSEPKTPAAAEAQADTGAREAAAVSAAEDIFFAAEEGNLPPGFDEMVGGGEGAELPDIFSVLALFLQELRGLAWLRMGLVANPATGAVERDLDQARVAIDTVAFLAAQLEQVVAPEERLPLKALVSDLQVNFVEQSKRL
ncbi:MAG TPA: DUF1844 domain-containing protein [Armatimonadaceae bacterium]|nr:DUF1844 domain-containing protein [Armatimonadaceae bacterium]